ncbi:Ribosome-recycling factor [Buchnera aphidicola (Eriosoma grossulariae)]|uniref:ribosome recycling factor n=1 Tax=Buchnera aphidicola TaxID=9 RepID=UPI003463BDC9
MILELQQDAENKMIHCVTLFKNNINKLRTGKASPEILDSIHIKYFGVNKLLRNISNISVEDSRTLKVHVFDKSISILVQKSIINADLGLNISLLGDIIRVSFPILTEERRKKLIKLVRLEAEQSRIAIRNIRRLFNEKIKKLLKKNIITKDLDHSSQINIQNKTNQYIKNIDCVLLSKEKELMTF